MFRAYGTAPLDTNSPSADIFLPWNVNIFGKGIFLFYIFLCTLFLFILFAAINMMARFDKAYSAVCACFSLIFLFLLIITISISA